MDDKEYQAYLNRLESEKPRCKVTRDGETKDQGRGKDGIKSWLSTSKIDRTCFPHKLQGHGSFELVADESQQLSSPALAEGDQTIALITHSSRPGTTGSNPPSEIILLIHSPIHSLQDFKNHPRSLPPTHAPITHSFLRLPTKSFSLKHPITHSFTHSLIAFGGCWKVLF